MALAAALAVAATALASSAPAVSGESAAAIGAHEATLSASVNPQGQQTTYAFEYGTDTHYAVQTAVQSAGAGTQPVPVSTPIGGLKSGTTYHYRVISSNASGTTAGPDATFTTTGIAPPEAPPTPPATGPATGIGTETATLNGTVNPSALAPGETETYFFEFGPSQPYSLQTVAQTVKAGSAPVAVKGLVTGLASMQTFHYRLVTVTASGAMTAGADATFFTLPRERLIPAKVETSVSPRSQRRLPDRVTVTGRMVPPAGMSNLIACRGYFDITFRVGQIAVQSLRAGIHPDCTFSLPVVFHNRKRLMGGRVTVHVLFAGNRFLHRLEAPIQTIQVG
jgi:hypothetical protein